MTASQTLALVKYGRSTCGKRLLANTAAQQCPLGLLSSPYVFMVATLDVFSAYVR
jgi:hypothetical protein